MKDLMRQAFNTTEENQSAVLDRILSRYPAHKRKGVAKEIIRETGKRTESVEEFFTWVMGKSFALERNESSCIHRLRDASRAGTLIGTEGPIGDPGALDKYPEHTFVVRHDWARAFSHAEGIDDSVKLPYDVCAFEFLINGHPVIAIGYGNPPEIKFTAFAEFRDYWICMGGGSEKEIAAQVDLLKMIWTQIRAICIALDAEVATHTVERASHTLNKKRRQERKAPLSDFHIVDLARRHRIENPSAGNSGSRKRLHFRRGHWRHYEVSKTWIRWCLVGDPDLGFIRKDYTI